MKSWGMLLVEHYDRLTRACFPPTCALCKKPGHESLDICSDCLNHLVTLPNVCPQCGLAHSSDTPENGSSPCDRCLTTPPPYDRIHAAYRYEGGIQRLIVGAKFHGCLANTRLLGHLLANSLELDHLSHVDLILAVPGNRAIFRQRGYNQALEIAKEVSKITRIPLLLKGCTKTRTTRKQAELSAIDRRFNLQNAFSVNPAVIQGRNVAIIDDVMTTGSTLAEIARTLKSAGASSVSGWVCARVF